ncbi:rod shape-determining protein MreD [Motiliproteus sp.]|uniref:rod shape-determining protein MreD n=1 Tax=Motiliproteus sp. TaxID=1898955 RepID=UPI003BACBA8F
MVAPPARGSWVILLSFMLALMLTEIPMPEPMEWGRPQWTVLVLIYWVAALPHRVGPWYAWIVGLLLDILQGSLLGIHALSLALVAVLMKSLHQRFRMYPVWQQALLVLVLVGLYQLLLNWGQALGGAKSDSLLFLLPSLVSAFFWPWIFVLLRSIRRALKVS